MSNKDIYEDIELSHHTFYSGDWDEFTDTILHTNCKFDVILTSETIYNEKYYDKLIRCFDTLLTADGTVYLAAKSYYFGVGGGLQSFISALNKSEKFSCQSIWKLDTGLSREVLKIKRKDI